MLVESEQHVQTVYGKILINIIGDRNKHPIVTFHDIGLNGQKNFQKFFQTLTIEEIGHEFCIYNINAPGQEDHAENFPPGYQYPTMDEMVTMVNDIVEFFQFKSFIGLGIGAGANMLLRYAVKHQEKVEGLILVDCVSSTASWLEWTKQKVNITSLRNIGMTMFTINYLLWRHFGPYLDKCDQTEVESFKANLGNLKNPTNLASFIEAYMHRSHIHISEKCTHDANFNVPVLQLTGARSSFATEVEHLHSDLKHSSTELLKIADCSGDVLNEKPKKVTEAILLFLQGIGFFPWLKITDVIKRIHEPELLSPVEQTQLRRNTKASTSSGNSVDEGYYGYFFD